MHDSTISPRFPAYCIVICVEAGREAIACARISLRLFTSASYWQWKAV